MRFTLAIILISGTAAAQPWMNTNDLGRVAVELPRTYTIDGKHYPAPVPWRIHVSQGWRHFVACPGINGSNATVTAYSDDGETLAAICDYAPIPPVSYEWEALSWLLLDDHPTPAQIPEGGMTYRLNGNPVTWWVVRMGDTLATQISAHDNAGNPIVRTVNLRTGEDETINIRAIAMAQNLGQLRAARVVSTNAAIQARNRD